MTICSVVMLWAVVFHRGAVPRPWDVIWVGVDEVPIGYQMLGEVRFMITFRVPLAVVLCPTLELTAIVDRV